MRTKSFWAAAGAAVILSGCSIDIHESSGDFASSYTYGSGEKFESDERLITIEERAETRAEGGLIADSILASARGSGCRTISVDSYRTLYERSSGTKVRGARVVLACDSESFPF
ncbi:MAG: hypothetical protein ACFB22_03525 [Rhodothalassiaceae bacterium]